METPVKLSGGLPRAQLKNSSPRDVPVTAGLERGELSIRSEQAEPSCPSLLTLVPWARAALGLHNARPLSLARPSEGESSLARRISTVAR